MAYPQFNFGDRIRKVRRDIAHMSQAEMADAIGVSQKVYSAWESGRSRPTDIVAIAKRMELLTGVSAGWLLDVTDGFSPHPPTGPSSPLGTGRDGDSQSVGYQEPAAAA